MLLSNMYNDKIVNSIEVIEVADPVELIDITVSDDHVFLVSQTGEEWYLTHNCEAPDIDCLLSDHLVLMADGTHKQIDSLIIGDKIVTMNGTHRCVTTIISRMSRDDEVIERLVIETHGVYGTIICTADHKLMLFDGTYIKCRDIDVGTVLHGMPTPSRVISKQRINNQLSLTDIEVEGEHTFQIVPFDVAIITKDLNRYACLFDTYIIDVHKNKLEQMARTSTIIKLE